MATASASAARGLGLVLVEFKYEYEGRDGSIVSIKPNERYVLLAKTNAHWWQVRRDHLSKPFYVPAKYVKELPPDVPSPLDFARTPATEAPSNPAPTPFPVPVPVPKTVEELAVSRGKAGDEVTIRLKPDVAAGYRKTENRMSTFGVPLEFMDLPPPLSVTPRRPDPDVAEETEVLPAKNIPEGPRDTRSHVLPIPVDTPTVPETLSREEDDGEEEEIQEEEEEEEAIEATEDSEQDSHDEEDKKKAEKEESSSNHIYESIQDLQLDTLIGHLSPAPPSKEASEAAPEPLDPAPSSTGHTPSSSVSSSQVTSPSPLSPQPGWQTHTDRESGKTFYFHPLTRQSTWTQPQTPPPSPPVSLSPELPQGGAEIWEQLTDPVSGRLYYYDRNSGATSWNAPHATLSSSSDAASQDDGPPPLPVEDYPVGTRDDNDSVFMLRQAISRGRAEFPDSGRIPNGVAEQRLAWRHSVAEDTFPSRNCRTVVDFAELKRDSHNGPQGHLLEKAGIVNKTKVVDNGKKIRKNWSQSWTVLHGGILTFHRDPKSAPSGNMASQIVPEYTVELRGASVCWAPKDKSSKKNVLELKTRQGCEYLMQYDTESIIADWLKVIQDTVKQLDQEHTSDDDDEGASDKEDRDKKRSESERSSSGADTEQTRVRTKLRRFLQRRPTLQSVKEKGYIRDNVFGCHLDTLCHRENSTIPKFVEKCIIAVERRGLDVDGIYRVSGNLAVIQRLRHKADHEEHLDLEDGHWEDVHVLTGALKLFLRELPEPLFPFSFFDKFIAAIQVVDYGDRVSYMKDLVRSLPLPNHDTMELLFRHLRRVVDHKDGNRMSVQSVAIVFGPTLLRPQCESANMTVHMVFQSQIVELVLNEFQTVFAQR